MQKPGISCSCVSRYASTLQIGLFSIVNNKVTCSIYLTPLVQIILKQYNRIMIGCTDILHYTYIGLVTTRFAMFVNIRFSTWQFCLHEQAWINHQLWITIVVDFYISKTFHYGRCVEMGVCLLMRYYFMW